MDNSTPRHYQFVYETPELIEYPYNRFTVAHGEPEQPGSTEDPNIPDL